jgi:TolB protein
MKQTSWGIPLVAAALTLAPCSLSAPAYADETSLVPWSSVGPGWMLATWNAATPKKPGDDDIDTKPTTDTLFLVSPEGARYAITTFTPPANGWNPTLADWSGDGDRALFYRTDTRSSTEVIEVDLHTGKHTSFAVDGFSVVPRYTRPEGKAVLLAKSSVDHSQPALERVDLAGHHQLSYPIEQFGSMLGPDPLPTPDGTGIVLGNESGGLALMGNDGKGVTLLPVAGQKYCSPTRWWDRDATIVVAECRDDEFAHTLWTVPVDGSTPTRVTSPDVDDESEVLGVLNAWRLPEGTFVQAAGGCGYVFLAKTDSAGTPAKVTVPNVDGRRSVTVVGTHDGNLELHASLVCGDGQSLLSYDPGTNTSTVLLGGQVNGGGVLDAQAYPGDE